MEEVGAQLLSGPWRPSLASSSGFLSHVVKALHHERCDGLHDISCVLQRDMCNERSQQRERCMRWKKSMLEPEDGGDDGICVGGGHCGRLH